MATSPRPYQDDYAKMAKTSDVFRQRKNMVLEKSISEDRKDNLKNWITFYRLNIDIFVEHYFGVKLFPYQKIWIYLMNKSDVFVSIAARACGKSWLVAVFALAKGVLWPGSEIVIVSATQKQASLIVSDKITRLRDDHPNIAREIRELYTTNNRWEVVLHNASKIKVVSSGETGRGHRSTVTVYEEFRLIDKEMVDSVIKPFAYSRQTPYVKLPEYEHLVEEPKEIYISSSYYKQHWWFNLTGQVMKMMIEGKSAGAIFFDYLVAVKHHLKTKKQIQKEKITMSSETFDQEYCNLVLGAGEKSYFNLNMFLKARNLKSAIYPQRIDTYNAKKNPYDNLKRASGEIRLLSVDYAMRSGSKNDNTIMMLFRLIPQIKKGYHREILFIESHNGMNSVSQALRVKQLVEDFSIDVLVMDVQNSGIALLDMLGLLTKDSERGKEYEPLTIMQHPSIEQKTYEELSNRCLSRGARPIIYPVSATSKLNSDVAVMLKDRLKKRMFSFLINDGDAEDILMKKKEYLDETKSDSFIRSIYLAPFVQSSIMISECLGLDASLVSGNIKLQEKPGQRKDRYTALAYGNYYASFLDSNLLADEDDEDEWSILEGITQIF